MSEAKFYNALNIVNRADYGALKKLKEKFGSWTSAWKHDKNNGDFDADRRFGILQDNGVSIVLREEDGYPKLLKTIHSAPHALYYKGDLGGGEPTVAIVGTRKSTSQGEYLARAWACEFARSRVVLVSGLALGIDEAAHRGSCEAGGRTFAVLGCGLSKVYPAQNQKLADEIVRLGGAVISEYPFDYPSYPRNFIQRNRIVSGMSLGVVVIEAPEKSGSLITANFALDENREVMVAPGPVSQANYVGSNNLLKDGARLITSPRDIYEILGLSAVNPAAASGFGGAVSGEEKIVVDALRAEGGALTADELIVKTGLAASVISSMLTILSLKDVIIEENGKYEIRNS